MIFKKCKKIIILYNKKLYLRGNRFSTNFNLKMKKLSTLLSILFFLFIIQSAFSQNSDDAIKELKKRYPVLMKTYGDKLQNLEVEYIVAIDLSGSMNRIVPNGTATYIEEVKRGIIHFLNAIPDNCKISIIGFGTTVRWVQIPTVINNANRSSISRVLNDLRADEGNTDLKGAINLLEEGCSSTSTIKYLFAFTDFNNDPPSSSPFLNTSWEELQQKFALISKTSMIEAFALKLPLEASSGRDLPSVRLVFPGLNVIEFDAASLQNWFSDRAGKMIEQNLWTFISKDLQKIQSNSNFNLKALLNLTGELKISGQFTLLPEYIQGLKFSEIEKLVISDGNKLELLNSKITREENRFTVGKLIFNSKFPLRFGIVLTGFATGKIITPAYDEIEKLYAFVSLHQSSGSKVKDNKSAESLLTYKQNIKAESSMFIITWPLLLFIPIVCFFIVFIFLLLKNTVFPYRLKGFSVKINNGKLIPLDRYYKYKISNEKGDTILPFKDPKLEFIIYGGIAGPFNYLIKKCPAIQIEKGNPSIKLNESILSKKKKYRLEFLKKITISEGLSQISLEFIQTKK